MKIEVIKVMKIMKKNYMRICENYEKKFDENWWDAQMMFE